MSRRTQGDEVAPTGNTTELTPEDSSPTEREQTGIAVRDRERRRRRLQVAPTAEEQSPGRARRPRAPGTSGGEAPLARLAGAVRKTDTRKSRRGGDHPQPKGEERTSLTPAERDVRTEQVLAAVPRKSRTGQTRPEGQGRPAVGDAARTAGRPGRPPQSAAADTRRPKSPKSPRVPDGPHVQARQPSGRAGRGLGRPARPGGRLPAGARPRHGAHGLAARLAQLAAGARGGQPALGALRARHPAGCAARAHVPAALHARCFVALVDARQSAPSRSPFCPCGNPDSSLPTARASVRGSILHTQATGFPPRRGRNHLSGKQG
ncbi:translation initiation factor IF-2-like [Rousettus aegyptiacus]|uniref:translation initiation factor IF-2-like n=1 Tax=Rousettus aegyptiacus TaxID=9407 RepID=UPI00168D5ACE|nr:translation initiation factor IF-2-like [Rousettus aegyptiacus]